MSLIHILQKWSRNGTDAGYCIGQEYNKTIEVNRDYKSFVKWSSPKQLGVNVPSIKEGSTTWPFQTKENYTVLSWRPNEQGWAGVCSWASHTSKGVSTHILLYLLQIVNSCFYHPSTIYSSEGYRDQVYI